MSFSLAWRHAPSGPTATKPTVAVSPPLSAAPPAVDPVPELLLQAARLRAMAPAAAMVAMRLFVDMRSPP